MEFHEKLQELRKSRGLTQEELAEDLYVSRTAISKWELGRGYPSIDSLKEISKYFSVTIDDLLSSERLLLIAEKENKSNMGQLCIFCKSICIYSDDKGESFVILDYVYFAHSNGNNKSVSDKI